MTYFYFCILKELLVAGALLAVEAGVPNRKPKLVQVGVKVLTMSQY